MHSGQKRKEHEDAASGAGDVKRPREEAAGVSLSGSAAGAPGYMSGFGNMFETEALEGALPVGQNNPQVVRVRARRGVGRRAIAP